MNDTNETAEDLPAEISDLPPEEKSHYILIKLLALKTRLLASIQRSRPEQMGLQPGQTRRQVRTRASRVLTALGLSAAICVLLLGNIPATRARLTGLFVPPTATPVLTRYSVSNGPVVITQSHRHGLSSSPPGPDAIGPLPSTCPQISPLQTFNQIDPPGVGSGFIWLNGFSGPTAAIMNVQKAMPPSKGWYETVIIFIAKGSTAPITLNGGGQENEGDLAFSEPGSTRLASATITIDPQPGEGRSFGSDRLWETTSITIYIPSAGCYLLEASWLSGKWTIYFAAGS